MLPYYPRGIFQAILYQRREYYYKPYYYRVYKPTNRQNRALYKAGDAVERLNLVIYLSLYLPQVCILIQLTIEHKSQDPNRRLWFNFDSLELNYYVHLYTLRSTGYINELVLLRYKRGSIGLRLPQVYLVGFIQNLVVPFSTPTIGQQIDVIYKSADLNQQLQLFILLDQGSIKKQK